MKEFLIEFVGPMDTSEDDVEDVIINANTPQEAMAILNDKYDVGEVYDIYEKKGDTFVVVKP